VRLRFAHPVKDALSASTTSATASVPCARRGDATMKFAPSDSPCLSRARRPYRNAYPARRQQSATLSFAKATSANASSSTALGSGTGVALIATKLDLPSIEAVD